MNLEYNQRNAANIFHFKQNQMDCCAQNFLQLIFNDFATDYEFVGFGIETESDSGRNLQIDV